MRIKALKLDSFFGRQCKNEFLSSLCTYMPISQMPIYGACMIGKNENGYYCVKKKSQNHLLSDGLFNKRKSQKRLGLFEHWIGYTPKWHQIFYDYYCNSVGKKRNFFLLARSPLFSVFFWFFVHIEIWMSGARRTSCVFFKDELNFWNRHKKSLKTTIFKYFLYIFGLMIP